MNGDQLRWTRIVNTEKLTVYRSSLGGYKIQGRGTMVGQRLVRTYRLLRDEMTIVEDKIGRLSEAKGVAERDYHDRSKNIVTASMPAELAEALIKAAMLAYNQLDKDLTPAESGLVIRAIGILSDAARERRLGI